jgi:hypothetical protein
MTTGEWRIRSKRRRTRWYLTHLPEAELFPSIDALAEAVWTFERKTNPTGFFIVNAMVAGFIVTSLRLWLTPHMPFPHSVTIWFWSILNGVAMVAYPTWRVRRRAAGELRSRLLELGVPVCAKCGYCLRGLIFDRCPECGNELDERVRVLIREEAQSGGGGASDGPAPGSARP